MPQWGFSPLKCADALGAAAAGQMQSALIGEVLTDNPYAYLPCNESYTSQVNGATPANPFIFSGGYLEPADANALPAVNRAADNQVTGTYVDGTGQQVSTGLAMNFLGDSGTGMGATGYGSAVAGYAGPAMLYTDPGLPDIFPGPASLEFWFNYSGTATQAVTLLNTYGAPSAFWTTAAGEGGILTVYANGSTVTTNTLSSSGLASATIANSGSPQHYALIVTGGTPGFLVYINGAYAAGAALPLTIGPVNAIALGPGRWSYDTNSSNASYYEYNYAAGHLAVYSYELTPARILAHYQAGANGWQGVSAAVRFSQILTWAQLGLKRGGWVQQQVTGQAEITQIGPAYDLSGQQASDAIYNVAQSEGGRYKTQANGSLVYLERDAGYNLPVSATLSDGTAVAPMALNTDPGFASGLAGWTAFSATVAYSPANRYGSLGALSVTPSGFGVVSSPSFTWNGGSALSRVLGERAVGRHCHDVRDCQQGNRDRRRGRLSRRVVVPAARRPCCHRRVVGQPVCLRRDRPVLPRLRRDVVQRRAGPLPAETDLTASTRPTSTTRSPPPSRTARTSSSSTTRGEPPPRRSTSAAPR